MRYLTHRQLQNTAGRKICGVFAVILDHGMRQMLEKHEEFSTTSR